jgi:hypothetical protein
MPHTTAPARRPLAPGFVTLRRANYTPQLERMKARMTELDSAHTIEIKHLERLLETAKRKFLSFGAQRG